MKAEVSEKAGVHRRLRSFIPDPPVELRRDASSDMESRDRGIQSERRLECVTDSVLTLLHLLMRVKQVKLRLRFSLTGAGTMNYHFFDIVK